ncbi:putative DNA-binding transcriptional regulator [Erwinia sp. MMLR14_017]|uniref:YfeC-like transcriptional regulator n=1 Tax=Erwinia sp. MMLR14_017 TaxID=3093842 RepID=UPI00298F71F7|nr:YfeC-like transcriptional regulator [Erwinia sp. MMLR14_017]MDW8846760.1 putative DNA-binding transcriptional regulator [Erwinia sp. MMLR14_017]
MKKEWLTPEELARETGFSRQTINKWVKKEQWITKPKPGVQGGKARMIYIDERVRSFLKSTRHAAEPTATYRVPPNSLSSLLLTSLQQMSPVEQEKLYALLLREGIQGLLRRLDISDSQE